MDRDEWHAFLSMLLFLSIIDGQGASLFRFHSVLAVTLRSV